MILNKICYGVEGVSFEKLFIIKTDDVVEFNALTWLVVEELGGQCRRVD